MNRRDTVLAGMSLSILAAFALFLFSGCSSGQPAAETVERVKRGKYLVQIAGCHDCHTPKVFTEKGPVLDQTRLLSGHPSDSVLPKLRKGMIEPGGWVLLNSQLTAAVGPWGVSYAVNLTPDLETGIGRWTEEAFIQSMRTGLHWGVGPAILPPMPWQNLAEMTDEDLSAVFVYLQSIKPIRNEVPAPIAFSDLVSD